MKSEDIQEGWIESHQLVNRKDVHPSQAIHVIKTEDVLKIIDEEIERIRNIPEMAEHHKFAKEFALASYLMFVRLKLEKLIK